MYRNMVRKCNIRRQATRQYEKCGRVFHQPLRQTEGLLRSITDVLGVDIAIPDHTTLCRRGGGLTVLLKHLTVRSHCIFWSTAQV